MPQCQGITRDEQQCRRDATAGRRFCFQHDHSSLERSSLEEPEEPNRRCTDDVDPISLVPLGEDGVEIIRIEGAPLASGLPGLLHCFNADSLAIYIRRNIDRHPIITNPLTREPIPIVQLDAIMDRLGIERPPPRARQEQVDFHEYYDQIVPLTDAEIATLSDADTREHLERLFDLLLQFITDEIRMINYGIRRVIPRADLDRALELVGLLEMRTDILLVGNMHTILQEIYNEVKRDVLPLLLMN